MRVIGEIPHPDCKITLFSWNNRYLIKMEYGLLEQTFKINQFDLASEAELSTIVNNTFIKESMSRFESMEQSLHKALDSQ